MPDEFDDEETGPDFDLPLTPEEERMVNAPDDEFNAWFTRDMSDEQKALFHAADAELDAELKNYLASYEEQVRAYQAQHPKYWQKEQSEPKRHPSRERRRPASN